jgi:hypothetical protein
MADTGFQPRGGNNSPRGLSYIRMIRARLVVSRVCEPGTIIAIEPNSGLIAPQIDGLSEALAEALVKHGWAVHHQFRSGDKPISVKPGAPEKLLSGNEWQEIESATLKTPAAAEKSLSPRGKAAV